MKKSILQAYIDYAKSGTKKAIDEIISNLNENMSVAESKFIDFALSYVDSEEGIKVMEEYLFLGTQIQRNYMTLFFNRRGDYHLVKKAYDLGLIDEIQAFSR